MDIEEARDILGKAGQSHVLAFWDRLDDAGRAHLLAQISEIDFAAVERLRGALLSALAETGGAGAPPAAGDMEPAPVAELSGPERAAAFARGEEELRAGRVGALLVAGGQGTRLGFDGPKGCFPIGPGSGESLFFFHARKLLAKKRRYGRPVPLYVMTSAANDAATRDFFRKRRFFGLDEEAVLSATRLGSCGVRPTLTVVLDLDPEVAFGRATEGGADRLESEGVRFQQRVRAGYRRMAELEPERVRLVDAAGTPEEVFARVVAVLVEALPALGRLDVARFCLLQRDVERQMQGITQLIGLLGEGA